LLLIGGLSLDRKWYILVGKRLQGSLGHKVLTGTQHTPGKSAKKKSKSPFLGLAVGEDDRHHEVLASM
jgi:hypothetical protein